jgi:hypothetical protein
MEFHVLIRLSFDKRQVQDGSDESDHYAHQNQTAFQVVGLVVNLHVWNTDVYLVFDESSDKEEEAVCEDAANEHDDFDHKPVLEFVEAVRRLK